jgi:DedD protein
MQDDAFHEIQLNGKQLVFLFMAATVVSVVIFLCGVLVGRGVRTARAAADAVQPASEALTMPAPSVASVDAPAAEPVVSPDSDPRTAAAPPEVDDLSYFSRLEDDRPAVEDLKPAARSEPPARAAAPTARSAPAAAPAPAPAAVAASAPVRSAPAAAAPATARAATPPPAGDWAVQVAALNVRSEAEAVAKRLSAKGYSAYVVTPGDGTPSVFRVRIGPFKTRGEADTMAVRLEKEEQFKPWVTR